MSTFRSPLIFHPSLLSYPAAGVAVGFFSVTAHPCTPATSSGACSRQQLSPKPQPSTITTREKSTHSVSRHIMWSCLLCRVSCSKLHIPVFYPDFTVPQPLCTHEHAPTLTSCVASHQPPLCPGHPRNAPSATPAPSASYRSNRSTGPYTPYTPTPPRVTPAPPPARAPS